MDVAVAPEPTLRERKKRSTRRALRLAALTLVAERGLDHVTTDEIAAAADVSPRTFFNYFAGKEDALVGNDPELGEALAAQLLARPADEAPLDAVRAVLREYALTVSIDERFWTLRMRALEAHPHLRGALASAGAELVETLTRAVRQRLGAGESDLYPPLLVSVTSSAMQTALWHSHAAGRPFADVVTEVLDTLAGGLAAPPAYGTAPVPDDDVDAGTRTP